MDSAYRPRKGSNFTVIAFHVFRLMPAASMVVSWPADRLKASGHHAPTNQARIMSNGAVGEILGGSSYLGREGTRLPKISRLVDRRT